MIESTKLDRTIPLPLYYQVKQEIFQQIQNGELEPGEAIPTEKELQDRYSVSRITIRRALSELSSEGYISRQSGRGTFVLKPKLQPKSDRLGGFFEDLTGQGFQIESQILFLEPKPVPRGVAKKLEIDEGKSLITFRRLAFADGEPIMLSTVYINLGNRVTLTREELESGSIFPILERKFDISLRKARKTLEVTGATEEEAELLHVPANAPLLLEEWIVLNQQEQPAVFMKALYRGDRYKHYSEVTR